MRQTSASHVIGALALLLASCGGGASDGGAGTLASFDLQGGASSTAGAAYALSVSAMSATGKALDSYTGTIAFESDDTRAELPAPYTFKDSDAGVHSFGVTFKSAGKHTIRVVESAPSARQGSRFVTVAPGALASLRAQSGDGQGAPAGRPLAHPLVVEALDGFDNPIPGVIVAWAAETTGSSVGVSSATTDADGTAATTATLGPLGSNKFTAASASLQVAFEAFGMHGEVHTLALASGDGQSGAAGLPLAQPLVVKATDELGAPYPGVTVTWAATVGGGTLPAQTVTTGPDGLAALVPSLGPIVGPNHFTATAEPLPVVPFDATGVAGAAATLAIAAGNAQLGVGASPLPQPLVVKVSDAFGNAVAGQAVTWTVASGAGSVVAVAPGASDASGQAAAAATLGASDFANSFTASAAGLAGSPVTFTATRNPYRLVYTDPAAGAGKLRVVRSGASTDTKLVLDVVVGATALPGYSTGMNLPVDTTRVALDPATPLVLPASTAGTLDPGGAPRALAVSLPTTGPLAGQIVVGLSQKAEGVGAVTTDTTLQPGTQLYSITLDLVATGTPGVVFDGTGAQVALSSGGLLDKAGNLVVGRTEVALGKLVVGP